MIIRIVKMTFEPGRVAGFLELFEARKSLIRHFEGCRHLELWHDADAANVYFTYSHWTSAAALEQYRHSDLFRDTWTLTKALFAAKAEAWSVTQAVTVS